MDRNSLKSCTVRHCRKRRESVGRCPIGGTSRGCSGATKSVPELTLDGHESSLRRPSFGQYVPAMWSSSFPRYIECRYLEKNLTTLLERTGQKMADVKMIHGRPALI